jgi:transcriptional regulator with XRE-family HTH domain
MPRISRTDEYKSQCGFRLRALRLALELTQVEAARAAGITKAAWGNYEQGKRLPDSMAFFRFSQTYNVTFDWVFKGNVSGLPAEIAARLIGHSRTA